MKPVCLKWFAFIASLFPFALTILLWIGFQPGQPGFQFEENYRLVCGHPFEFPSGCGWHLTDDGLADHPADTAGAAGILLHSRPDQTLHDPVPLLETGMLGVFLALDLLLFFVFWEIGLVPMYFLINQWGGENRNYASLKFILYTMAGSLGLLLSIQLIGVITGTFDLVQVMERWQIVRARCLLGMPVATVKAIIFWAFVIAFAIKVPVWPFHTWLPDAHTEAPDPRIDDPGRCFAEAGRVWIYPPGAAALPGRSTDHLLVLWLSWR